MDSENNAQQTDRDPKQTAAMDDRIQKRLGDMLKAHYDDLVSAPIPDQFLVLLAELEAKETAQGDKK